MTKRIFHILTAVACCMGMALPASAQQDSVAFAPQNSARLLEQLQDTITFPRRAKVRANVGDNNAATGSITIRGSVFGGGKMAGVENAYIDVSEGKASTNDATVTATVDIYPSIIQGNVFGGNDISGDVKQPNYGTASAPNQRATDNSTKVTIHNTCTSGATSIDEIYGGGNGYYTYCFTYPKTLYEINVAAGSPYPITNTAPYNETNYRINYNSLATNPYLSLLFAMKAPDGGLEVKAYAANETDFTKDPLATYTVAAGTSLTNVVPIIHDATVTIGDAVLTNNDNDLIKIDEVYGGAKMAWVSGTTNATVNSGTINKLFAGNNYGGIVYNTVLTINGTKKPTTEPTAATFASFDWTNVGKISDSETNCFGIGEAYGGGNAVDVQTATTVNMNGGYVGKLFGGNNLADMSSVPTIKFAGGNIGTSYGGGNAGDMQGCEAAYLDISQYLNNDLFLANDNVAPFTTLNGGDHGFTTYCSTEHYLYFYGAETLLQQATGKSLKIGNVYGGCRAANVDLSTYVRVNGCDYIGTVYGGCDMAGSVGAKPKESKGVTTTTSGNAITKSAMDIEYYDIENKNGYAKSSTTLPANFPIMNLSSIVTLMSNTVSGNMFAGGNGDYQYVTDGDYTKVYASSDVSKTNLLTSFKTTSIDRPWTVSSIAAMEGGTLSGTLYGGGNNADVGKENSEGRVYVLLGKTARGILSTDATGPVVSGTVYAGGKKSNVYGAVDILVKSGCNINTLYAGNDISGTITGTNRGNYLAGTAANAITTVLYGKDSSGNSYNNTYCGWRLDQPNGDENDKAQVYVRVEDSAKITTLYGGANGDYTYTKSGDNTVAVNDKKGNSLGTVAATSAEAAKPVSKSNFLDVKGIIGTCYGGGNAADVEVSNTYITGDAQVTRAFGGGNAATVTKEVNLYLDCDGTRSDSKAWVDGTKLQETPSKEPNVRFIFAGNNLADMSIVPSVTLWRGSVMTVYGGGNQGNMTGHGVLLTNQVDYMSNDPEPSKAWATQMANNFSGITWKDKDNNDITFDLSKVICFPGTDLTIDSKYNTDDLTKSCGLVVGEAYAGCRAANVDNGAYVRVSHCDYIKNIYGGCDIAGSVGAKPGTLTGIKDDTFSFAWVDPDGTNNIGVATFTDDVTGIPMWNAATWVYFTGGTCDGNIYGGGNGNYTYTDNGTTSTVTTRMGETVTFDNVKTGKPWVIATTLFIEGGTINGNVYGGGNKAEVGHQVTDAMITNAGSYTDADSKSGYKLYKKAFAAGEYLESSSFLCIGKGDLGRENVTIKGDVYGGGRMADVYGCNDIITLHDVKINRLFAGNDISGSVGEYGAFRGTRFANGTNPITCMIGDNTTYGGDATANPTLSIKGDTLTAENANVYVRLLKGGTFKKVFGGGNGEYDYTTGDYAGLTAPTQKSTWIDIACKVGQAYGGGNNALQEVSNLYIVDDAEVDSVFGGGNSATVTGTVNLVLDCDTKRSTQDYVDGTSTTNVPNVGMMFAGNNKADMYITPEAYLKRGSVQLVYGGGNEGNMLGSFAMLTDQSAYMAPSANWGTQMANNFTGIKWYSDQTAETNEINFDMSKVIAFVGTAVTIDSPYEETAEEETGKITINKNADGTEALCGLVIGDVYGGCRAANVNNGAYVRVTHCDYVHEIYGGCDIAGSVGATPGYLNGAADETFPLHWVEGSTGKRVYGHAKYTTANPNIPMWNTATWVIFTGGTCAGHIYGSGNGNYDYTSDTYKAYANNKPWVSATTLFIEGGTIEGNVYGGGNKADVGHQFASATKYWDKDFSAGDYLQSSSFLCIGKADLGRSNVKIKGDVFGGGRISDIHGTIDILTLGDVNINRLFAGNDVSGSIKGNFRGTRFSTDPNPITCMIGDADNMEDQTKTYDGTELTTTVANVYVRLLKGGHFGTVFGGGNGDYNYSDPVGGVVTITDKSDNKIDDVTAESADDAKPNQSTTWVDILAHVGNAYGGGNAAKIDKTNICLVGDGAVGVVTAGESEYVTGKGNIFGGCKSADVTLNSHVRIEPYAKGSTNVPYVNGNVFGGCDISGNVGDCTLACVTDAHLLSDHSNGSTVGHAHVDVLAGTVTGRVFGGGNGLEDATGTAYYTGTPVVSGTKPFDIFSYPEGSTYDSKSIAGKQLPVCQNTYVVVKNATIGTNTGSEYHTVFGGGQGAGTKVMHNVFTTMGDGTSGSTVQTTVNGIEYGGSYAGFVNSTCEDVTRTLILGYGSNTQIKGDIYGGSYGNYVRGEIQLNINNVTVGVSDTETAGIYAGNNNAGQPECNASINYVGNDCNVTLYGGGNMAPFYGTTRITFTKGSVGYIYGGGNHAPVYGNTIVEVLGGHVCHDVFGGGNQGGVFVNKASDTDHNSYGKDYGGNTLVIVRDDCLKLKDGSTTEFEEDAITGNYAANRDGSTFYFDKGETSNDGFKGYTDPYTADHQLYVLTPNGTTPVKSTIEIEGNVYGGGNAADVEGKATVIIGNKAM